MFKNVASQKIALFAFDTSTGAAKTGDAANITAYVNKDWAGVDALADTSATEISSTNAAGWYLFDLVQAESNADALLFTGKSSTSNITVVGQLIFTLPTGFTSQVAQTGDAYAALTGAQAEPGQGAPAVNASPLSKLAYLFKAWRNKTEQTATQHKLYADDASTVDQKATVSDDGTTFTRGEMTTGP